MTREEAIKQLKEAETCGDTERAHDRADAVLCDLLRSLGYDDVADAWDEVPKWYA